MPITLPPISRRYFLGGAAALAAGLLAPRLSFAAEEVDPNRIALLSDIHIHADKAFNRTNCTPFETLGQACSQITAQKSRPSAVIVNGDCAALLGNPADYVNVIEGLAPLSKAGMPVHLALGNHDHRANILAAIPRDEARQKDVEDRVATLISTPRANLFVLDSLDIVNKTPGLLGEKQIAWLAKALDARADKPAIIFIHHDPLVPEKKTGLMDTDAFYDVILPRKHVKAWVFGHTHVWSHREKEGVHLVNLPPTAWLFNQALPRGWVDLTLRETGATFTLNTCDPAHPKNSDKFEVKWR